MSSFTNEQYQALLRKPVIARRNPAGGASPSPVPERPAGDVPLATAQAEGCDTAKYAVRVTSYRTRLLDEDNMVEKYHVDSCRYAGLIPGDSPDQATIKVSQVKVKTKDQCRTEIEIERIA
jgi:hypothetical protein